MPTQQVEKLEVERGKRFLLFKDGVDDDPAYYLILYPHRDNDERLGERYLGGTNSLRYVRLPTLIYRLADDTFPKLYVRYFLSGNTLGGDCVEIALVFVKRLLREPVRAR